MTDVKQELVKKVEKQEVKITKTMSIAEMIKALEPEIKKALPSVITPERFTRRVLSALNTTTKLSECTQMSFLAELMNAAQLGLEPSFSEGVIDSDYCTNPEEDNLKLELVVIERKIINLIETLTEGPGVTIGYINKEIDRLGARKYELLLLNFPLMRRNLL